MNEESLGAIMGLIIHRGDAKSNAMEALQAAKEGNFEEADEKIKLAEAALVEDHHSQTGLLTPRSSRKQYGSEFTCSSQSRPLDDLYYFY